MNKIVQGSIDARISTPQTTGLGLNAGLSDKVLRVRGPQLKFLISGWRGLVSLRAGANLKVQVRTWGTLASLPPPVDLHRLLPKIIQGVSNMPVCRIY